MANNYNSNNFYFDRAKYVNQNKRTTKNVNLIDSDLLANDPNQYQFQFYDRFDTYKGLFNTQQLIDSVDFNSFENHCFFDSAVSKTEAAFNQIYDKFPLDGTKKEIDDFLQNIDGFTRNIYNQFEKNIGYLKFENSYIEVINKSGELFSFSRNEDIIKKLTNPVLDPNNSSFAFDFRLYIPTNSNQANQIIFQHYNGDSLNGYTCLIKNVFNVGQRKFANIVFCLTNYDDNNKNYIYSNFFVNVGSWNHIIISIDNLKKSTKEINVYLNEKKVKFEATISSPFENLKNYKVEFFNINKKTSIADNINFTIGKGNTHINLSSYSDFNINSTNSLLAYIDEFRYFHSSLDENYSIKYKDKNIYSNDALKLYFRFNEPVGVHQNNSLIFDYSGNSLHCKISLVNNTITGLNFRQTISNLREKSLGNSSLKYEEIDLNPVLIPSYQLHINLNNSFIENAKEYDLHNPNLIFKLFPKHYFLEGMEKEGFIESFRLDNAQSYINESINADSEGYYPGQQKKEAAQTFANLLIIWARFFDQLKLYLQILPKIIDIEYSDINQKSFVNFFIPLMAKLNGFEFKEILNSPVNKLLDGYILGKDPEEKSNITLRYVQNEIWKRIIINSKDIISSKGTINSLRSIFHSVGIIPEEYYRFREYSMNPDQFIDSLYTNKTKIYQHLDFSKNILSSFNSDNTSKYYQYYNNKNILMLQHPDWNFYNYYVNDSVSFNNLTIEFFLNYNNIIQKNQNALIESILKIENTTLTNNPVQYELIFIKENEYSSNGNLYFFIKNSLLNNIQLDLTDLSSYPCIKNVNLLDGSHWHISLQFLKYIPGISTKNKILLKLQRVGLLNEYENNHSLEFLIDSVEDLLIFNQNYDFRITYGSRKSNTLSVGNTSRIGSAFPQTNIFSNNTFINKFGKIINNNDLFSNYINFNGNISFIKLWKKIDIFENIDLIQHSNDPNSLSLRDILNTNNDISKYLLLDLSCQDKNSISENIENDTLNYCKLIDYSQNLDLESTNYRDYIDYIIQLDNSNIDILSTINNKSINIKQIDIKFDEKSDTNKVKSAGYFDVELASKEDVEVSPVSYLNSYIRKSKSDIRFSIEMSNVKHLNEDMSNLLADFDNISSMFSDFAQLNEMTYIDFEKKREMYFKRITTNKLNMTPLYEIYQIFDNILTELLANFIAGRVKFNNNIYVIESHAFERHKYFYKLGESQNVIKGNYIINENMINYDPFNNSRRSLNYILQEGRILREHH